MCFKNCVATGLSLFLLLLPAGCRSFGGDRTGPGNATTQESRWRSSRRDEAAKVRKVVCLFDQRPWINADLAGDRDPEGMQYRVFLDTGNAKAQFAEGEFRIELYKIQREPDGKVSRTLASDWHYPTSQFTTVRGILGEGYRVQLRWAQKDLAGSEIELITQFKDRHGNLSRSDTKRLRIPKYVS